MDPSLNPITSISPTLLSHILVSLFTLLFLLPLGTALGISYKSKVIYGQLHIYLQLALCILIPLCHKLGEDAHHERKATQGSFSISGLKFHKYVEKYMMAVVYAQAVTGLILKGIKYFWTKGGREWSKTRLVAISRLFHSVSGKSFMLVGIVQIIVGGWVLSNSLGNNNLVNSLLHVLAGSSLISWFFVLMAYPYYHDQGVWLKSESYYVSIIMQVYGLIIGVSAVGVQSSVDSPTVPNPTTFWIQYPFSLVLIAGGALSMLLQSTPLQTRLYPVLPGLTCLSLGVSGLYAFTSVSSSFTRLSEPIVHRVSVYLIVGGCVKGVHDVVWDRVREGLIGCLSRRTPKNSLRHLPRETSRLFGFLETSHGLFYAILLYSGVLLMFTNTQIVRQLEVLLYVDLFHLIMMSLVACILLISTGYCYLTMGTLPSYFAYFEPDEEDDGESGVDPLSRLVRSPSQVPLAQEADAFHRE